jgi:peptidoglycan/LPS O-acetylase OafA/YrhL
LSDPVNFDFALRYVAPTFFAIATAAIIVVYENAVRQPADDLSRRLILQTQILGTLTFAIYMWHEPLFTSFATLFPTPRTSRDTLMALVAGTAAVILFSWVTWRAVEKPFDDLRQRP